MAKFPFRHVSLTILFVLLFPFVTNGWILSNRQYLHHHECFSFGRHSNSPGYVPQCWEQSSSSSSSSSLSSSMEDFNEARQAFEKEFAKHSGVAKKSSSSSVESSDSLSFSSSNALPLLTSSVRRMKEMELELLDCLQDSDDAIDPLVDLWIKEKQDVSSATILSRMEEKCSKGLIQEEAFLRSLLDEYYSHYQNTNYSVDLLLDHENSSIQFNVHTWIAEPMSRLATLLFIKGRYEESLQLCFQVLNTFKPWHFEMAQLAVAIYLRTDQYGMALEMSRKYTLPELNPRTNHKRRKAWVKRNYQLASSMLQQAIDESNQIQLDVGGGGGEEEECSINGMCWQ